MLDTQIAQIILASHKIAYLVVDPSYIVTHSGGSLSLRDMLAIGSNQSLIELLPELIGYDDELNALVTGERAQFRLTMINRDLTDDERQRAHEAVPANADTDEPPSKRNSSALLYLNIQMYPYMPHGEHIAGLIVLLEDATTIGETSQRITQQHNELYLLHQQLHRSNQQLAAANAELRTLDELKSRFVSIAAHELRTPIATLIGYVDFLLHDQHDPLSSPQRSSLTVVRRSARRLLTITSDLLDITRLEVGRLELVLVSTDLYRLVQAVLLELRPEIEAKQLVVTQQILDVAVSTDEQRNASDSVDDSTATIPPILCDEKRTIQIMTNLLSNAIKYNVPQGHITLTFMTDLSAGMVRLQIADTGIGIPAEDLRQLGKVFFRARNVNKARTTGTGLGLHIVQSLIELHGGSFAIASRENEGTTVTVALPIDDG